MNRKRPAHRKTGNGISEKEVPRDEFLYTELFDAILSRRLRPGTKLTEDELVDIFGVSRAVVRRALLRLSHDRIVDIKLNHGASVSSPTIADAREILDARRLIESSIVRSIAGKLGAKELKSTRQMVERERAAYSEQQPGSGIRLSGDFHIRLAQLSGNATLLHFMQELVPRTSLVIAQYEKPSHSFCSHEEHFELLDMIANEKKGDAVALMCTHIDHIEDKLDLNDRLTPDLRHVFSDNS